jgi:hypothetical protein
VILTIVITIAELETSFPFYCKALRILIQEGKTIEKMRRWVCWSWLATLHYCLPRQYKDPEHLYDLFKGDENAGNVD